ncbi:MAG: hypothetical protein AB8H03_11700 [Saprospiraceae bacterium]
MKKITKILAVLFIYFFLLVIDGCVNCGCPDNVLGYFDFKKFTQEINTDALSSNEKLEITLSFDEVTYLAQSKQPCWDLGLINTATACSCEDTGEGGLKFPLTEIKIISNNEISPNYPAGTFLDSSFYLIQLDYKNDEISTTRLSDIDFDEPFSWFNYEEGKFLFQSVGRLGELGVPHVFTIQFTKSNGEIVTSETPQIIWN